MTRWISVPRFTPAPVIRSPDPPALFFAPNAQVLSGFLLRRRSSYFPFITDDALAPSVNPAGVPPDAPLHSILRQHLIAFGGASRQTTPPSSLPLQPPAGCYTTLAMSFLAGRLAATEGAFFLQESKNAAGRLAQKLPPPPSSAAAAASADVLPEILRHSLPLQGSTAAAAAADPSLATASKWLLPRTSPSASSGASPEALNPLRAYVSLPQASFGPKRWQLPDEQPHYSASTANELRQDRYPPLDSEKLKAAIAGYSQIGKAFVIATTMVFGGAAVLFLYTARKLQLHSTDDIRTKGRDVIQPGADILRERMIPLRTWAERMSRKWHFQQGEEAKERTIVKELSKAFGARTSN